MNRNAARLLLTCSLLLALAVPAAAAEDPGGGGGRDDGPSYTTRRDYRAARSAAIGLTAVGFLLGVAGMAMSADRPEAYHQARRLVTVCVVLFVIAVADRIVVQGVAGWFDIPDRYLPEWWR